MNPTTPSLAPYMEWAKKRPAAKFDLANSNVLACSIEELRGAREALTLSGRNEDGYTPLLEAIAQRYGVGTGQVATAQGTSGANFQVFATLLTAGDEVLVEHPGYDPLPGAAHLMGARTIGFDRNRGAGYRLDPDRVRASMTSRTRLIVLTRPHNPTGAMASPAELEAIGRLAESAGAHVLVDEVYLDAADGRISPAARLADVFISSSSLTKSYGLAALRCGWTLSSAALAERFRRTRDVIDGTGPIVTEQLATLAFAELDRLHERAMSILTSNRALVRQFLDSRSDIEWFDPGISTVIFPRIRAIEDIDRFAERLLAERDTAIVPGRYFGAPAHFRLGLGGTTDSLRGGLERLGAALDSHAW